MRRALIVDDKPENLYYLEAMFSANGYLVDQAANGLEALATARAQPPDLIVTDILMPEMDGFTLCRQWRQDPRLQGIPFVFYTATYTEPKDEQFARSLGADLFLIKPQEPHAFMLLINGVMQRYEDNELLQAPKASLEESAYLRGHNEAMFHKLEHKLKQLERASKVKDVLLGSVSHQLRTPLTPVALLVGQLVQDPDTPPRLRGDLEIICQNIEIEKRLISDLIDYASMQCGCLRLQSEPLSMHTLLQQTATLWRGQIEAAALRLDLCLLATSDEISGDRIRLEQVLWSLMHHASRRSPEGGLITLQSWNPQPDRIAVAVRDAGRGMSSEAIAWAFSPYERETRIGEGDEFNVGLGLAVSKCIVDAHGGSMSIQSGRGAAETVVTVGLPLRRPVGDHASAHGEERRS